jgi:hypothetical protein
MFKRRLASGLLLGLIALMLVATASASTYKKPAGHDCGKVTITGGFGGPLPANVPKDAVPQVHTFILKGKVSCATARSVMAKFEKSFQLPGAGTKGISPTGWKCQFSAKLKGQECTNSAHAEIQNGIVYVVPKK